MRDAYRVEAAWWLPALVGLVAFRVALPLAALAAGERGLPGQPGFEYDPYSGDATAYYAGTRELISAFGREPLLVALLAAIVAAAAGSSWMLRRRRADLTWVTLALPALASGAALAAVVRFMAPSGTGALGWPVVWSIPLFPLRAAGALNVDSAFVVGLVLSLLAIAVIVASTAYVGLFVSGSPVAGIGAAGLYAAWPFLSAVLAGERGWENGTWETDVGLHMYSEPVSTAAVTVALMLTLTPRRPTPALAWLIGLLAGFAVLARLSNFVFAVLILGFLLWQHGRRLIPPAVAGGLASVPPLVSFWPIGYTPYLLEEGQFPVYAFSTRYVVENWTESLLWHPQTLVVLAPAALIGLVALRKRAAALLGSSIIATAGFYSLYYKTDIHPRFLFVALPALLVLEAAGGAALVRILARRPALPHRDRELLG